MTMSRDQMAIAATNKMFRLINTKLLHKAIHKNYDKSNPSYRTSLNHSLRSPFCGTRLLGKIIQQWDKTTTPDTVKYCGIEQHAKYTTYFLSIFLSLSHVILKRDCLWFNSLFLLCTAVSMSLLPHSRLLL